MQIMQTVEWESRQLVTAGRGFFEINVIYTSKSATLAALRSAVELAAGLGTHIRVIVLRLVPYPLSLNDPPVNVDFDSERLLAFVGDNTNEGSLLMCHCRDEVDALRYLFGLHTHPCQSGSIVVIGGRKRRWFRTKAQRIAAQLEKKGHQVVFVEPGGNDA
jgi:hypothetical protein